jgi:hypothetical protein
MPQDHSDVDALLVSKQPEHSDKFHAELIQALGLLPLKFKEQLASFGVRIILVPTILEILPSLDIDLAKCFGVDQAQCEEYAKSWPVLYEPPSKTIYIGEKWDGYKGNIIEYSVLNRCAFAFQMGSNIATSAELLKAINDDFDCVPGDLMPQNVSDPGEFYAAMFAVVVMLHNSEHDDNWMRGMTLVYPRTAAYIQTSLNEFR